METRFKKSLFQKMMESVKKLLLKGC